VNQLSVELSQELAAPGATDQKAGSQAAGSQKLRHKSSPQSLEADRD
jgi:hypothetical protein